ncbi:MAG: DUF3617 domain-containing protein [Burkholderiaceae bacterium]
MGRLQAISKTALVLSGMLTTGSAGLSAAEPSVPVVPGQYEMSNNIVENTSKQCFTSDRISAATIREQMGVSDSNQCDIVDSEMNGKDLILNMNCRYEGNAKGTGRMTISSTGEQLTIKSVFKISVEGQERTIEMTGKGKRIGGC